jgi:hypothetical protein
VFIGGGVGGRLLGAWPRHACRAARALNLVSAGMIFSPRCTCHRSLGALGVI